MSTTPALSILIPNYDNGRAASKGGDRDFIAELLHSLHETLVDDPTPLEIIIADDGSTDDSLETCRTWAARTWRREGRTVPFCRLLEGEHTGVLSVVANRLTEEARGAICCRLDGDVVVSTERWASKIVAAFDAGPPDLGVVGPLQFGLDGRIHSAGSWVLHPRSHHHVAHGAPRGSVTRAIEVDHVMGCFYCHRRSVWVELGGYDETLLRGQTVDFGLRARKAGWRCFSIPTVEFVHAHSDRRPRATGADSAEGIRESRDRFAAKWGFDRLAADLDDVAARYGGTPLVWNANVFGPAAPWPPRPAHGYAVDTSIWARYANDAASRQAIDARVDLASSLAALLDAGGRLLVVGAGTGLLAHLLARRGRAVVATDRDAAAIDFARDMCAGHAYPGPPPTFIPQSEPRRLPLDDESVDFAVVFDVLETHRNPVGLIKETRRVIRSDGAAAFLVRERAAGAFADSDAVHAYRRHELGMQLRHTGCFSPIGIENGPVIPGTIALFARPRSAAAVEEMAGAVEGV